MMSLPGYGHEAGAPLECLSIYVELTKMKQMDPRTGEVTEKVGFRICGGIDTDPSQSPYPDRVSEIICNYIPCLGYLHNKR